MDCATYIAQLLEQFVNQGRPQPDRNRWLAEGRGQYTPEVCNQTVQINDEFPVHEE